MISHQMTHQHVCTQVYDRCIQNVKFIPCHILWASDVNSMSLCAVGCKHVYRCTCCILLSIISCGSSKKRTDMLFRFKPSHNDNVHVYQYTMDGECKVALINAKINGCEWLNFHLKWCRALNTLLVLYFVFDGTKIRMSNNTTCTHNDFSIWKKQLFFAGKNSKTRSHIYAIGNTALYIVLQL